MYMICLLNFLSRKGCQHRNNKAISDAGIDHFCQNANRRTTLSKCFLNEYIYRKLPLLSLLYDFVRSFILAYKRKGLYPRWLITGIKKPLRNELKQC